MTSTTVATAEDLELLAQVSESTLSRSPGNEGGLSGFCTSCGALGSGSESTEPGWQRRQSYDSGIRRALTTYINSPLMEQLSLELTVHRVTIGAMARVAQQRERLLSHWKSETKWWREEHDRVSAEYGAFVKDMARRFAK